ncbi:MAG: metalloregulator ArsR/SmtB family transcription factor [Planctomycetota bacterium]
MANYKNDKLETITDAFKALADPNRARIIMALSQGSLCVCRILGLFKLAPSTVSKHLYILKKAGLIQATKRGRWIHYSLTNRAKNPAMRSLLQCLRQHLDKDNQIKRDRAKLAEIMKQDPEKLCRKLKNK